MPHDAAHERLAAAWLAVEQHRANLQALVSERRWHAAETAARRLRWACSELEAAITEVQFQETNP